MSFKTSMLEYCKLILKKISFNRKLFLKEYKKSLKHLAPEEKVHLRKWTRQNFRSIGIRLRSVNEKIDT
jgi:hypothetical protein